MSWVTWVTWGFVALAGAVVLVAVGLSRGWWQDSFDDPYELPQEPDAPAADPGATRSGVDWSEPAAGRSPRDIERDEHDEPDPAAAEDPPEAHHPRTTGEPADGRNEAQDR